MIEIGSQKFWHNNEGRLVCLVSATHYGDVRLMRGDQFLKDGYKWVIEKFVSAGVLCRIDNHNEGCLFPYISVAEWVEEYNQYTFFLGS